MGSLTKYFSDADLKEIKLSVKDAEAKTSAEIVPFFAEASHHYREANFILSFLSGAVFGLFAIFYDLFFDSGWVIGLQEGVMAVWFGALFGFALGLFFPKFRLYVVDSKTKSRFVHSAAREAFLREEVFRTEARIGILLYISLEERMTVVLPDTGIVKAVPASEWTEVVNIIVKGMKFRDKKNGIIEAIWYCGDLLEKYEIRVKKVNPNEISDELRSGGTKLN